MNTEPLVINDNLDVTGSLTVEAGQNGTILTAKNLHTEVPEPSPVIVLNEARLAANTLAAEGATYDIRYAAMKSADLLGRLLRHLEHHRQVVGG